MSPAFSPINNIREKVLEIDGNEDYVSLNSLTKFREQWMVQDSDRLSLNERVEHSALFALSKSYKTKMRNQAKLFCTTLQTIDEIQRGVLCNIYLLIILTFNLYSPGFMKLSAAMQLNVYVLLIKVIPFELVESIYSHIYKKKKEMSRKIPIQMLNNNTISNDIHLLFSKKKETQKIYFDFIASWVLGNLINKNEGENLITAGKRLPLESCVDKLKEHRGEIVEMFKLLDNVQCQIDGIGDILSLLKHIQMKCEQQSSESRMHTMSMKTRENIMNIEKITSKLVAKKWGQYDAANTAEKKKSTATTTASTATTTTTTTDPTLNQQQQTMEVVEQVQKQPRKKSTKKLYNPAIMGGGGSKTAKIPKIRNKSAEPLPLALSVSSTVPVKKKSSKTLLLQQQLHQLKQQQQLFKNMQLVPEMAFPAENRISSKDMSNIEFAKNEDYSSSSSYSSSDEEV